MVSGCSGYYCNPHLVILFQRKMIMPRLSEEKETEIRKAADLACGYSLWDIRILLDEISALREELEKLKRIIAL